jgi:hypothetical protein
MNSQLNIMVRNSYEGYENSLLIHIIRHVSPVPVVRDPSMPPDIEITGPYVEKLRRRASIARLLHVRRHNGAKVRVYHTAENTRYEPEMYDYSITSDLGVTSANHFRMPNWWDSVDWSKYGINHPPSPRIRRLIDLGTLLRPLGESVLNRPRKAAIFASHMREPRLTLFKAVAAEIAVDGYGPYFKSSITNHNSSGIYKDDILRTYMCSLCPENSMYPGYYTEKVPESYAAGSIPITWADQNIATDFKVGSYINLADYASRGYSAGIRTELAYENLLRLCSTPLLGHEPDFQGLLEFVNGIVGHALR